MNLFFLDKDSRFFVVQSRESLTIHICKTQFCSAVGFETYNSCNTGIQSLPLSACCGQSFQDYPLQEAFEAGDMHCYLNFVKYFSLLERIQEQYFTEGVDPKLNNAASASCRRHFCNPDLRNSWALFVQLDAAAAVARQLESKSAAMLRSQTNVSRCSVSRRFLRKSSQTFECRFKFRISMDGIPPVQDVNQYLSCSLYRNWKILKFRD